MCLKLHVVSFAVVFIIATTFALAGIGWFGTEVSGEPSLQARWHTLKTRPFRGRLADFAEYRPYGPATFALSNLGQAGPLLRGSERDIDSRSLRSLVSSAARALLEGLGCPGAYRSLAAAAETTAGITSWRIWNDLGVAYLECAPKEPERAHEALHRRLAAFEAVSRALTLNPSSQEAAFNRALILESIWLVGRAREAWENYVTELDSASGWAEEARGRASILEAGGVESMRSIGLRSQVELDLLPRWSAALAHGDPITASELRIQLDSVIARLGPVGSLHAASVAALAAAANRSETSAELALGHRLFAEGIALYRAEKAALARKAFQQAGTAFRNAGSPFEIRAELQRFWAIGNPELQAIQQVLGAADEHGFSWAGAEATRLLAWRHSRQGAYIPALDLYGDAARRFKDAGLMEEAAVVESMRAQLLMQLSRPEEALAALAEALPVVHRMADAWNRYAALWVSAEAVRAIAPGVSTELQLEALQACNSLSERPLCRLDLLIALTRVGLPAAQAAEILDEAEKELARVEPSEGYKRTRVDLLLARARLLLQSPSPESAEEALGLIAPVLAFYRNEGLDVSTAKAKLTLARALEVVGRTNEARTELRQALRHVRRWDTEQRTRPETVEAASPTTLRELFERLIVLAANEGDVEESFLLAEEMRHRMAPMLAHAVQPPEWATVEAALSRIPHDTAVIEYAIVDPYLIGNHPTALAWVLTGDHFNMIELTGAAELGPRLRKLRRVAAAGHLETWREQSAALWRDWMAPVLEQLPADTTRLLVVPDSELFDLPFRALLAPDSGRYLDQDFTIALAPSFGMLAAELTTNTTSAPLRILSLGFRSFHGRGHSELPRAEDEARLVEATYGLGRAVSCTGKDWLSLRACLPQVGVLHLVTHAAASAGLGSRSWIALQDEDLDLKRLWKELPQLPKTELVVLAACETVAAPAGGEGLGGLARPFLARGARAVVGTLQPIEDEVAHELFPAFHSAYAASYDAAEALREAREQLPNWENEPWEWGRVEAIVQGWN